MEEALSAPRGRARPRSGSRASRRRSGCRSARPRPCPAGSGCRSTNARPSIKEEARSDEGAAAVDRLLVAGDVAAQDEVDQERAVAASASADRRPDLVRPSRRARPGRPSSGPARRSGCPGRGCRSSPGTRAPAGRARASTAARSASGAGSCGCCRSRTWRRCRGAPAVQSAWIVYMLPPSPVKPITVLSGRASLMPSAPGMPTPSEPPRVWKKWSGRVGGR